MNTWVAATAFLAALMRFATATYAGGHSAGISSFPVSKHGPVGYHGPLAKPIVQKDGHLADTLEVAAARGEHLIAVAKAHSTSGYGSGDDYGSSDDHGSLYDPSYEGALHGIYSHGPSTGDIYKGEYGYAGLQSFSTDHSYGHGHSGAGFGQDGGYDGKSAGYGNQGGYSSGLDGYGYSGSGFGQDGGYDGKSAGYGSQGDYSSGLDGYGDSGSGFGGTDKSYGGESTGYGRQGGYSSGLDGGSTYHGPLAAPVVLKSGYLPDTHDVAAAKGAHYVALSQASQHGGHH